MGVFDSIPFLDLCTQHCELEPELSTVFQLALRSGNFIGGPMVEDFERAFSQFCSTRHAIGVGSGTDALRFALIAAGVKPKSVVLTVPNTFIATTEAISQAGAYPEFVDVDQHTYNISVEALRCHLETGCSRDASGQLISKRIGLPIAAIVPVHLYGQMADMDNILDIAGEYGLTVIEDACQAHGAEYFSSKLNRWCKAGSMGKAAAFSFYPGKNLGACGEAGAVTTNDDDIASTVRMLRDHGQRVKYFHTMEGYNGRLDSIQAGFLRVKLDHLGAWNELRRLRAADYNRLFISNSDVICPYEPSWSRAVFHLYVLRTQNRDDLIEHLKAFKIGSGIHYPVPLHTQNAYSWMNYQPGDFPIANSLASEIVSLPMFPHLRLEQQAFIAEQVEHFTNQIARKVQVEARESTDRAA